MYLYIHTFTYLPYNVIVDWSSGINWPASIRENNRLLIWCLSSGGLLYTTIEFITVYTIISFVTSICISLSIFYERIYIDLLIFPRRPSVLSHTSFQCNWIAWHFKMITSIINYRPSKDARDQLFKYTIYSRNVVFPSRLRSICISTNRLFVEKRKEWWRSS